MPENPKKVIHLTKKSGACPYNAGDVNQEKCE
jgi:hypothetical protein